MEEMQAFYDAFCPTRRGSHRVLRAVPARRHARGRQHLLQLLYSIIKVSFPVEAWRQPNVPDSGAANLDLLIEPIPRADGRRPGADRWSTSTPADAHTGDRRGRGHRIAAVDPTTCPPSATESTSATSRCCPASWTWRSTCSWAGPTAGTGAATSRTTRVPHAARGRELPHHPRAGFTTVRNLGLMVKTGGYLLDVALARDRQRLDRRAAHRPGRPRHHPHRAATSIRRCSSGRARHHAAQRRGGHRQRRARGAQGVRYQIKYGASVIKISASGGVMSHSGLAGAQQYSDEELRPSSTKRTAPASRSPPTPRRRRHQGVHPRGVDCIEHGSLASDETIQMMVDHGTFLVPTSYLEQDSTCRARRPSSRRRPPRCSRAPAMLGKAIADGVKIACGTDAPRSRTARTPRSCGRWSTAA